MLSADDGWNRNFATLSCTLLTTVWVVDACHTIHACAQHQLTNRPFAGMPKTRSARAIFQIKLMTSFVSAYGGEAGRACMVESDERDRLHCLLMMLLG